MKISLKLASNLEGAKEFLPEAGKRAIFGAKRPTYGRCAPYTSPAIPDLSTIKRLASA
jgi:hypothetical protein